MKKLKAFTMAEAVLVMTILGIIATVMITTMKPAKFKDQGYDVLAKSIYASIDTAVTQVLVDKAPYNQMSAIYVKANNATTFNMANANQGGNFILLLKNYMATARGTIPAVCTGTGYNSYMLLKNGACLAVSSGGLNIATWIPGEIAQVAAPGNNTKHAYGMIFLDTNGDKEPNVMGKDQYYIPMDINGIISGD